MQYTMDGEATHSTPSPPSEADTSALKAPASFPSSPSAAVLGSKGKQARTQSKKSSSSSASTKPSTGSKNRKKRSPFPDKPSPSKRQRGISTEARTEENVNSPAPLAQQQGAPLGDEPFPRAPILPPVHQRTGVEDYSSMMRVQQERQLNERLQLQEYLQQQQQQQGFYGMPQSSASLVGGSTGLSGFPSAVRQQFGANSQHSQSQQQRWANMLLSGSTGNASSSQNEQLWQLMQQQELQRQLEEQAAVRRQLMRLRGDHSHNNASSFGGNWGGSYGGQIPSSGDHATATMANLLRQQQHHHHQQQQQQQQQHYGLSPLHQPLSPQMPAGFGSNSTSLAVKNNSTSSSSSRVPVRSRASGAKPKALATPIEGFPAPSLPTPRPRSSSNVIVPPVEENDIKPYNERSHASLPLGIPEDPCWLSEFQCFVRKELIEVFRASHADVKIRVASKKVFYQQAGIRCKFCAHLKPNNRAIRSSAFPSSKRQIYQSFTMMLRDHFGNCSAIPEDLKTRFLELKRTNTQGASDSMRYWNYSATKLGMVDSENGILLNEQTQAAAAQTPPFGTTPESLQKLTNIPARLIVAPSDAEKMSHFLYRLLTQYQMVRLLQTECIGNRKSLQPNVPGLGCRFCCRVGRLGLSRVFPAKKKQLQQSVQEMYDHIRRCNLCPSELQEELVQLYQEEKTKQGKADVRVGPEGEKVPILRDPKDKEFLEKLWERLGHKGESATAATSAPP